MAEEIDLEKCNFWNFRSFQKLSDLDLDLELGQSHTGVHIRSRSTHIPN